jgi:hypothetical protein
MDGFVDLGYAGLTASVVMIVAAILLAALPKFASIKWARMAILPLVLSGVGGLASVNVFAGYSLAGVATNAMVSAKKGVGALAPAVAGSIALIVALVMVVVVLHNTWAVAPSRWGVISAVGAPVTLGFIPGALGTAACAIVGIFPLLIGALFSTLLGR